MGGIYPCKCYKDTYQDNSYVCFIESSKISRKLQQEIREKNNDEIITNVKTLNSTVPNTAITKNTPQPKRKNKEKNRSELLKIPLEIINESGQEEIISPCLSKQFFHHFDFNPTSHFKIDVHKVETKQPISIVEENQNPKTLKNKSLSEKNTISINSQMKEKTKKNSVIHRKLESINSWKKLSINSIVSSKKLNSNRSDEYLLQGDILKYLIEGTNPKSNYSQKFFVITKNEMTYHKSKESFLSLHPSLGKIPIFQVKKVERISYDFFEYSLNKQYHHFIIELNNNVDKKNSIEILEGLSNIRKNSSNSNHISNNYSNPNLLTDSNDKSLNLPSLLNEMNSKKEQGDISGKKGHKISLITKENTGKNTKANNKIISNSKEYNSNSFFDDDIKLKLNSPTTKNRLYIFAGKNHDIVNKIVYLLNYLIDLEKV